MRVWPGEPYPLGATWTGVGVNFALFSAHATKVELCLFDSPDATTEAARIELPEQTGYRVGDPQGDLSFDNRDNAAHAPLAAVVDPAFTWGDNRPLRTPWRNTVIYEMHVRGFWKRHPRIPEAVRGTYEALTTEPVLEHLKELGVTAAELMPIHYHARDRHLEERGLTNYWGYNSFGHFAPERRLASSRSPAGPVREFKRMVRALHEAGLE